MAQKTAYQAALGLLSRRDHFRRELEDKLRRRGFSDDDIAAAVARCLGLDLLNDNRVGERFVEVRAATRGWGPHRLAAELKQRGLDAADAERMSRLSDDLAGQAMRTALRKLELRAPGGWWRDGQRRARMLSSLITRGFEADVAIAAVDDLAASRENHSHALDDQ
jgi:SOS response regulatory protein OraA/RecX